MPSWTWQAYNCHANCFESLFHFRIHKHFVDENHFHRKIYHPLLNFLVTMVSILNVTPTEKTDAHKNQFLTQKFYKCMGRFAEDDGVKACYLSSVMLWRCINAVTAQSYRVPIDNPYLSFLPLFSIQLLLVFFSTWLSPEGLLSPSLRLLNFSFKFPSLLEKSLSSSFFRPCFFLVGESKFGDDILTVGYLESIGRPPETWGTVVEPG